MTADRRDIVYIVCFAALICIASTSAFRNHKIDEQNVELGVASAGSRPNFEKSYGHAHENTDTFKKSLSFVSLDDAFTVGLHNKRNKETHSSVDSSFRSKNNEQVRLTIADQIEDHSTNSKSRRQTDGFGAQTGYRASVGFETAGVAGVDGAFSYPLRPKRSNEAQSGFGGHVSFGGGENARAAVKHLQRERKKRENNGFGGAQSGFDGQVGFGGGARSGAGMKHLKSERFKRQSSGFGGKTGFGANASFGIGAGVGGTAFMDKEPKSKRRGT